MPPVRHSCTPSATSPYVRDHREQRHPVARQSPNSTCQRCRIAKHRCIKSHIQDTCLRCQSLGQSCYPQANASRSTGSMSIMTDTSRRNVTSQEIDTEEGSRYETPTSDLPCASTNQYYDPIAILSSFGIDSSMAAQCFEVYTNDVMPLLPIVVFAEGTDAQTIRRHRPLLFAAVVGLGARVKGLERNGEIMMQLSRCVVQVEVHQTSRRTVERIQAAQILIAYNNMHITVAATLLRQAELKNTTTDGLKHCLLVQNYLLALHDQEADILDTNLDTTCLPDRYQQQVILLAQLQLAAQQASSQFQVDNNFDAIKLTLDKILKRTPLVTTGRASPLIAYGIAQARATVLLQALSALQAHERPFGGDRFREETRVALRTFNKLDDRNLKTIPAQYLYCLCDLLSKAFGADDTLAADVLEEVRLAIERIKLVLGRAVSLSMLQPWIVLEELLSSIPPLRTW